MNHLPRILALGVLVAAGTGWQCAPADKDRQLNGATSKDSGESPNPSKTIATSNDTTLCQPAGKTVELPAIPEASGLAASLRTPGILWTHNDTDDPVLFAIDASGNVKGQIRVTGAKNNNWEDVSVAPCLAGSCLYIADIGDNGGKRKHITVYRVKEPLPSDTATDSAQAFPAEYPRDGSEDAEGAWVTSRREVYIVTKGETGSVVIYRYPGDARVGASSELRKIVTLESGDIKRREMITDADLSPDERWVVLRSDRTLMFYPAKDLMSGKPKDALRFDLTDLKEPQGEGVAVGPNGMVYLAGEGGGKSRPGTLNSLRCQLPR